ncbi:MAG: hypothetical protein WCA77_04050 [Thermoplasmata archaeon]
MSQEPGESLLEPALPTPRKFMLGSATPRGYGARPRLSPEAAAAFATYVDTARARAAIEGRTLVYTVRWN